MIVGIVAKNGILMLDAVEITSLRAITERCAPPIRTATLSTCVDDITGSNAGNVATALAMSRFRLLQPLALP